MAVSDVNIRVIVTVSKEDDNMLKKLAENDGRSKSNFIYYEIIKPYLESKKNR